MPIGMYHCEFCGEMQIARSTPPLPPQFPEGEPPSSQKEESMKPESIQQMKRLMDARDLLRSAIAQYTTSINTLKGALEHTEAALTAPPDEEAAGQITALREFVTRLSHESLGACETCSALAEILEVLASEVTVREEHVPAGVS
jgi:hypothetical protein